VPKVFDLQGSKGFGPEKQIINKKRFFLFISLFMAE